MLEASEGYQGRDNLLARSVARWQAWGWVSVDARLRAVLASGLPVYLDALVRYHLAGGGAPAAGPSADWSAQSRRRFRLAPAGTAPEPGERLVERVRDGSGREWAVVLAARVAEERPAPKTTRRPRVSVRK
jgi:hypothetical protein